jgi:hypothetical protein
VVDLQAVKIFTVCFEYKDRPEYAKLLRVFRESVRMHMPDVEFVEIHPPAPPYEPDRIPGFLDNTIKLQHWLKFFRETNDNIIFADCDMLAVRDGRHAFDPDFDIAYTAITPPYKAILNGGIIMTKPTEAAHRFMTELYEINNLMFQDIPFHEIWRAKYAGMNQAAFGCVLETGISGAKIHKYMTWEWNAIDRDLKLINAKTVFIHMKSKIRELVMAGKAPTGVYSGAMQKWYDVRRRITG